MSLSMQARMKQANKSTSPPEDLPKSKESPDMEMQVLAFCSSIKLIGGSIPLEGASNCEIAKAFPNVNSNSLRYAVYNLRKKGLLVDRGDTRSLVKGRVPSVVWYALSNKG